MPPRILIADDNAMVRTALRQLLADFDHTEFIEAEDGRQAVSQVLELQPEIVILDLAMPVMDGLTAAREINRTHPETPIFLCTMHWSPHLEAEARKAGVRQVVSKAHVTVLVAAIEHLLRERRARATSGSDATATVSASTTPAPDNPIGLAAPAADKADAIGEPKAPPESARMRRSS